MKCLFIFNPYSGKGRVLKNLKKIVSFLENNFELVIVHRSLNNRDFIKAIYSNQNNIDCVIVAGGDGTVSLAVNAILHTGKKLKLGILPFGTVNDVSRSLKIPRRIKKALKTIAEGKTFLHDVIKVNNRYGIYVFGAGIFTETSYNTSQKAKKCFGRIAYAFHAIRKLSQTKNKIMNFTFDKQKFSCSCAFFLLSNSRYVAGQNIEKKAILNDGKARIAIIASNKSKPSLPDFLKIAKLFIFHLKNTEKVKISHIEKLKISCTEPTNFNLDGECFAAKEANISVIKEAIEIFIP